MSSAVRYRQRRRRSHDGDAVFVDARRPSCVYRKRPEHGERVVSTYALDQVRVTFGNVHEGSREEKDSDPPRASIMTAVVYFSFFIREAADARRFGRTAVIRIISVIASTRIYIFCSCSTQPRVPRPALMCGAGENDRAETWQQSRISIWGMRQRSRQKF